MLILSEHRIVLLIQGCYILTSTSMWWIKVFTRTFSFAYKVQFISSLFRYKFQVTFTRKINETSNIWEKSYLERYLCDDNFIFTQRRKERDRAEAICLSGHSVVHLPRWWFAFQLLHDISGYHGARDFSPANRDRATINVAWNEY